MGSIVKANLPDDLLDIHIGGGQKLGGFPHIDLAVIVLDGFSEMFLKHTVDVGAAVMQISAELRV